MRSSPRETPSLMILKSPFWEKSTGKYIVDDLYSLKRPSSLYNLAANSEQKYVFFSYSSSVRDNFDLNWNSLSIFSSNSFPRVFTTNPSIMSIYFYLKFIYSGLQQILAHKIITYLFVHTTHS